MTQKILFLDVDGVLISAGSAIGLGYCGNSAHSFDRTACALVQKLCDEFGYSLVISSTWASHGKEKTASILQAAGISAPWHDDWITPRKFSSMRATEIGWWLEEHPEIEPKNVLILDDMDCRGFREDGCCVIQTEPYVGFTYYDFMAVFAHNGKEAPGILM